MDIDFILNGKNNKPSKKDSLNSLFGISSKPKKDNLQDLFIGKGNPIVGDKITKKQKKVIKSKMNLFGDWDGDGVINALDCQPKNRKKHGIKQAMRVSGGSNYGGGRQLGNYSGFDSVENFRNKSSRLNTSDLSLLNNNSKQSIRIKPIVHRDTKRSMGIDKVAPLPTPKDPLDIIGNRDSVDIKKKKYLYLKKEYEKGNITKAEFDAAKKSLVPVPSISDSGKMYAQVLVPTGVPGYSYTDTSKSKIIGPNGAISLSEFNKIKSLRDADPGKMYAQVLVPIDEFSYYTDTSRSVIGYYDGRPSIRVSDLDNTSPKTEKEKMKLKEDADQKQKVIDERKSIMPRNNSG